MRFFDSFSIQKRTKFKRKTYPLIRRKPVFAELDLKVIETVKLRYNEGEYSKTYSFKKLYVESPICVATAENENLNAYIVSVNRSEVTVEISAPALAAARARPCRYFKG